MPYTEAQIRENMRQRIAWLERGILAIYNKQGFSSNDSDYLSYVARWIMAGKSLSGKHQRQTRALMMKYAGQLVEIANAQNQ